jgi:hypothetical protein
VVTTSTNQILANQILASVSRSVIAVAHLESAVFGLETQWTS